MKVPVKEADDSGVGPDFLLRQISPRFAIVFLSDPWAIWICLISISQKLKLERCQERALEFVNHSHSNDN